MKSFRGFLAEAKSPFNVGDKVHVGPHLLSNEENGGKYGTVTHTNGFGHTHVLTNDGEKHVFKSDGTHKDPSKNLGVYPLNAHINAVNAQRERNAAYAKDKNEREESEKKETAKHDPIHKEIIDKLVKHSGDKHLENLTAPKHQFDRHGRYNGSSSESEVRNHEFPDLFHKIHKEVRIHNASPEDTKEHGITHHGRISYNYTHPGGGSNGHDAGDFTRHTDGSIKIHKTVHTGKHSNSIFSGDKFEKQHVKTIK